MAVHPRPLKKHTQQEAVLTDIGEVRAGLVPEHSGTSSEGQGKPNDTSNCKLTPAAAAAVAVGMQFRGPV